MSSLLGHPLSGMWQGGDRPRYGVEWNKRACMLRWRRILVGVDSAVEERAG
jgi:hypothetical protein